jgi:hypothetical protein
VELLCDNGGGGGDQWVSRLVAESITPRSEFGLAQVEQSTLDE